MKGRKGLVERDEGCGGRAEVVDTREAARSLLFSATASRGRRGYVLMRRLPQTPTELTKLASSRSSELEAFQQEDPDGLGGTGRRNRLRFPVYAV